MLGQRIKEKRDFIRMTFKGDVICKVQGTDRLFSATAHDISHSGIKFETTEMLKRNTKMDITVKVDSKIMRPLKATFLVRRVQHAGDRYIVSGEMIDVR